MVFYHHGIGPAAIMVAWCFIGIGRFWTRGARAGGEGREVKKESSGARKDELITGSFADDSCVDWEEFSAFCLRLLWRAAARYGK